MRSAYFFFRPIRLCVARAIHGQPAELSLYVSDHISYVRYRAGKQRIRPRARDLSVRYVTISKAVELSGYSEKAIRRKIAEGVWVQNRQWRRAPDSRILIDLIGVEAWVEGEVEPASRPGR
jgi:hypothetical protein